MHYVKKNIARLIFLFICFLIYCRNTFTADITFNQDLIFNEDITVQNNINLYGPLEITNTNQTIKNFIIANSDSNSKVIFEANSNLHLPTIDYFTGTNPLYLIINMDTKQIYTTSILQSNFNINELIVSNIISNTYQDLIIGNKNNNIFIGTGENKIIFAKNLIAKNKITSNYENIIINDEIFFSNNLTANTINATNADITINQNIPNTSTTINCQNFTINEPLQIYNNCTIGNNDLEDTIIINEDILTQNIIFGTGSNPILIINGLPIINNPESYLINNIDNTISILDITENGRPIMTVDSITNDNLSINKIIGNPDYANIIFKAPLINIKVDSLILPKSTPSFPIKNIYSNSTLSINGALRGGVGTDNQIKIYTPIANIVPKKKIEFLIFFESINKSGFTINNTIFNGKNYFFKNLLNNSSTVKNICIDINQTLVYSDIPSININKDVKSNLLSPISFTYNDYYKIENNDLCRKTKKKIVHFGFIAEDLAKLEIPNILKFDSDGNIYDYDTNILWDIFDTKLTDYQNFLLQSHILLEQIINYNNNLALDIKKREKKINTKTKIYEKLKNYIENANAKELSNNL
jgi:hypothetical protein